MKHGSVRGMSDILPDEIPTWIHVEGAIREIARRYNYREIRLPLVEHTEVFSRGIGEGTDVVNKEMYTFSDRKGRSLSLRPEATASVVRAYLEHGLHTAEPFQKLFYLGPMFRYEKPQKGRSRQFHQFGVEVLGSLDPSVDVEVIALAWSLMDRLRIGGLWLRLNSIGCREDRVRYRDVLREHFVDRIDAMCSDCRRRYDENPLRILDCKEATCQPHIETAPGVADHLCGDCAAHFGAVRGALDDLGLEYRVDPRLVRGLDYYTRTVFELMSDDLGAQDTLLGGGRYDGLVELFGGPATPGIGFAGGTDRLILVMHNAGEVLPPPRLDLFVAALGEAGQRATLSLVEVLRRRGLSVDVDHRGRALRKQLDRANRLNARYLLVLGDEELASGRGRLKEMDTGEENDVPLTPEGIGGALEGSG